MPSTLETAPSPTPNIDVIHAGQPGSAQAFAAAFQFLRTHSDGRYSDRTLMTVGRWETRAAEVERGTFTPETLPDIYTASTTVTYDEDTEVKQGGTLATAVCLPTGDGSTVRTVVATTPSARRQGLASRLVERIHMRWVNPHFWVGNGNRDGQRFLLSCGLLPQRMNGSGAILFARTTPSDDELVAR